MTTFSATYDTETPIGDNAPSVIDDRIRQAKEATRERCNVDHYWALADSAGAAGGTQLADPATGEHRKITFYSTIDDPTAVSGKAHLYMKSDELYYQDDTNTTMQITSGGNILGDSINMSNDTYITSTDAAGTGSVNLIKANTDDVACLSDGAVLAAATASADGDRTIADKAYVDAVETASKQTTPTADTCTITDAVSWFECDLTDVTAKSLVVLHVISATSTNGLVVRPNDMTLYDHDGPNANSASAAGGRNVSTTQNATFVTITDDDGKVQFSGAGATVLTVRVLTYIPITES